MSRVWRPLLDTLGLQPSGSGRPNSPVNSETLPLYSSDAASDTSDPTTTNPRNSSLDGYTSQVQVPPPAQPPSPSPPGTGEVSSQLFQRPTLSRFLADFTLGFADGLTVPFALTAGLSSLGHTDTVIYAGMAEICAGSISMGIGGYLSARGEVAAAAAADKAGAEGENSGSGSGSGIDVEVEVADVVQEESESEKGGFLAAWSSSGSDSDIVVVANYLEPLELPPQLREMVLQHTHGCPAVVEGLRETQRRGDRQRDEEGENGDERLPSPLMAGFSVALGYLLGGVLPLFPYFFVRHVKDGLSWSFGVCAVALFLFGFCKDFALSGEPRRMRGSDIRRSAWEGAQMVFLGSVAALAAVLCVRAFEGIQVDHSEQSP